MLVLTGTVFGAHLLIMSCALAQILLLPPRSRSCGLLPLRQRGFLSAQLSRPLCARLLCSVRLLCNTLRFLLQKCWLLR